MRKEKFFNRSEQKELRRYLRNHFTPAEVELWKKLRKKQVRGLLFRRQFGVGPYVLDFYCPELRLAIELDGAVHDSAEAIAYDRERTDYLTGEFGIHVLRFRNELVFEMPERILIEIGKVVDEITSATPPSTPPFTPSATPSARWASPPSKGGEEASDREVK